MINVTLGVVTGIVQEFQFGWSRRPWPRPGHGIAVAGIYQVDRRLAGIVLLLLAANSLAWPPFNRRRPVDSAEAATNPLSAGERQRLGLARLMLSDAPIALVDEPTAHLDTETEREVLRALRAWARGRTLLLVTHRLDDLETFDRVIVMEGGRVIDEGPGAILAQQGGAFAKLRSADAGLLRG